MDDRVQGISPSRRAPCNSHPGRLSLVISQLQTKASLRLNVHQATVGGALRLGR